MSLASLKKRQCSTTLPSAERANPIGAGSWCYQSDREHATEVFIDDAIIYANGGTLNQDELAAQIEHHPTLETPIKRATFSLGENAIAQLNELSDVLQTSKTGLLRHLIHQLFKRKVVD